MDTCQAVQYIADHASGGGAVHPACILCRVSPAAGGLAPGQQPGRALHPAGQSSSMGAAGGAEPLAAAAASLVGLSPDS